MTRFWILQLAGKKLVRLLPPAENSRANPTDSDLYLPTLFTADLLHPNFGTHPGLDGAIVYEALLEPGDILHIPEGWGHQALNLEWSAMVSTNCALRLRYAVLTSELGFGSMGFSKWGFLSASSGEIMCLRDICWLAGLSYALEEYSGRWK